MDSRLMLGMKARRFARGDAFRNGYGPTAKNEGGCSVFLNDGRWLMTWSQGTGDGYPDQRIVGAVSDDLGRTWSQPVTIVASKPEQELHVSCGALFAVPGSGRVYVFFFWLLNTDARGWLDNPGFPIDGADRRYPEHGSGHLSFVYSDDNARTWSDRQVVLLPRREWQALPDRIHGWVNIPPQRMPSGEVVLTYTSYQADLGIGYDPITDWRLFRSETNIVRCDNILEETDPEELQFTLLPEGPRGIRLDVAPYQTYDALQRFHSVFFGEPLLHGSSFEEMTVVPLADGRWMGVGRTKLGCPCYTVSSDQGQTWSAPQPLRTRPDGGLIRQPMALCPIAKTPDGRLALLFHNNSGFERGASHIWDTAKVRNPQWLLLAKETGEAGNAGLWFGDPLIVAEAAEGRTRQDPLPAEIATPQFVERKGHYFVTYSLKTRDILVDELPGPILDAIAPKW